jgi:hypothetical protein
MTVPSTTFGSGEVKGPLRGAGSLTDPPGRRSYATGSRRRVMSRILPQELDKRSHELVHILLASATLTEAQ